MAKSFQGRPCQRLVAQTRRIKALRLAVLLDTPGTSTQCLARMLRARNLVSLEVIGANASCLKFGRCEPYECLAGRSVKNWNAVLKNDSNAPKLHKCATRAAKWSAYVVTRLRPETRCSLNPALENPLNRRASQVLYAALSQLWAGRCEIVDNRMKDWHRRPTRPATLIEVHGWGLDNGEPWASYIANTDGMDAAELTPEYLQAWAASHMDAESALLWTCEDNCRCAPFGAYSNPRTRNCKRYGKRSKLARFIRSVENGTTPLP